MKYAIMNSGVFVSEASGNTAWSPKHFQTAESLSDEERAKFNLYEIVENQGTLTAAQKWGDPTYEINGTQVTRTWVVVDKTTEELAAEVDDLAAGIRDIRNNRIALTDWMGLSDNTMTSEWAAYRQALRDIPSQEGFPHTVVWPRVKLIS